MLSITGVLFLISLLILVNLPLCPFVLLIIPQLNFHTLSMVMQGVPRNNTVRDLGVIFSSNLSWSDHINAIVHKGYSTLHLLCRAFPSTTPVKAKKLLFTSSILPKLTYCSPIWRPYLIKDIVMLERIQKRATKYDRKRLLPSMEKD